MSTAGKKGSDADDNVSVLTSGSQTSIWSHAAMLLRGEHPDAIAEEDSDSEKEEYAGSRRALQPEQSLRNFLQSNNNPENIDFLMDDPKTMTYGRRIAMSLIGKSWYNPLANAEVGDDEEESDEDEEDEDAKQYTYVGNYLENGDIKANGHEETNGDAKTNGEMVEHGEGSEGSTETDQTVHWTQVCHPTLKRALLQKVGVPETHAVYEEETKPQTSSSNMLAYPFTHTLREMPNLAKAWAYFDHVALSRFVDTEQKLSFCSNPQLNRAEPGERGMKTALYSPILTPHSQLGDFGLGIGLYFATLRAITVLCILASIVNIPNFMYFSSSAYGDHDLSKLSWRLQGSAICNDTEWVPCDDCSEYEGFKNRTAYVLDEAGNELVFYLRNNCEQISEQAAYINYATTMLVLLGVIGLNVYLRNMEIAFDEDEQTAQDYSVIVHNPPGDATDPKEWHDWVAESFGGHATAVTVAVDNDLLVRSLVERREILRKIELLLDPGTSLDHVTLAGLSAAQERNRKFWGYVMATFSPGLPELFARLTVLTAKVQGLAQQDYPATNVFLTLETEKDQRTILKALNVGSSDIKRQRKQKVKHEHLFRKKHLLDVSEADEPNTVRWQDLNEKWRDRLKQQGLTTFCTIVAIVCIALMIYFLNDGGDSPQLSAYGIAIANSIFPMFAKMLTGFEAHSSEGGKQRSLYFKIALFRWANTAVVISIITPFTSTLTQLIPQIDALFFAEIVTTNLIQILDPAAPRAVTQDAMNLKMQGSPIELAERYTNMTKILFLALWYCSIYPGALVLCALALSINYYTDRFSLMRTWKRPPMLGSHISEFSRRYFISLAVVAMSVMASYYWSGFPFDNLCPSREGQVVAGRFEIINASNPLGDFIIPETENAGLGDILSFNFTSIQDTINATVSGLSSSGSERFLEDEASDTIIIENPVQYEYCLQDFFRYSEQHEAWTFPFIHQFQVVGGEWMSDSQERVTTLFGWTSVAVIGLVLLSFWYMLYKSCRAWFHGVYSPNGDDQGVAFSELESKATYIPEVNSGSFAYPLLAAANLDAVDEDLFEWSDPDRPHAFYDLTKDAEVLLQGNDVSSKVVFSQVAHFPPGKQASE